MNILRRALIGEYVFLQDGRIGKVTGINDQGMARIALHPTYVDVLENTLTHAKRLSDGTYRKIEASR